MEISIEYRTEEFTPPAVVIRGYDFMMVGENLLIYAIAKRIIDKLPKMTPGKQRGRPVRVPFSIPVTFKLQ